MLLLRYFLAAIFAVCLGYAQAKPPNIIFILSDDLGYGDVSISPLVNRTHEIPTPNIQRLADEGMRFLRAYSAHVCAPSRCTLMTGRHLGHCTVRGNGGSYTPLLSDDVTVAQVLRDTYTTGCVGKWGLGDFNSTGYPLQQGFDYYVGHAAQKACHNWYPGTIQNNTDGNCTVSTNTNASEKTCGPHHSKCTWMNDLINQEAINFIRRHAKEEKPFFLFFSTTTPHSGFLAGNKTTYAIPAPYDTRFPEYVTMQALFAGATSAQDDFVGAVLDELKAQNIDEDTVVFFSGDNGPDSHPLDLFDDPGPFRGKKRSLHEGGVRQTMVARWPGHIAANSTTDHLFTFWDFLPTAAELGGVTTLPAGIDGVSAASVLQGHPEKQQQHKYLYWECCYYVKQDGLLPQQYPGGWIQAIRYDTADSSTGMRTEWKAIRSNKGEVFLYNLTADISESQNLSAKFPDVVQQVVGYMEEAHVEDRYWKSSGSPEEKCCTACSHYYGCGGGCVNRTALHASIAAWPSPLRRTTVIELIGDWRVSSERRNNQDQDLEDQHIQIKVDHKLHYIKVDVPELPCIHGANLTLSMPTTDGRQMVNLEQSNSATACYRLTDRGVLHGNGNTLFIRWRENGIVAKSKGENKPPLTVWQVDFDFD